MPKTESESKFEEYLKRNSIDFRYEEKIQGISKLVDYSFEIDNQTLRIDVKEWKIVPPKSFVGCIDPYSPIRDKIEEGREKFKQYKKRNEPCILVLYRSGQPQIDLDDIAVLGAMRGNFGYTFPIQTPQKQLVSEEARPGFLADGKMIHHAPNGPIIIQNTTISAIAVLEYISVCSRRASCKRKQLEAKEGRSFNIYEAFEIQMKFCKESTDPEYELRLRVFDNIECLISINQQFPFGLYDERFGIVDGHHRRRFCGALLKEMENEEKALGIVMDDPFGLRS
jgi:hypothetical protein